MSAGLQRMPRTAPAGHVPLQKLQISVAAKLKDHLGQLGPRTMLADQQQKILLAAGRCSGGFAQPR